MGITAESLLSPTTTSGPSYHSEDTSQASTGLDLPTAHCTTSLLTGTSTSTPTWAVLKHTRSSRPSLRPWFTGLARCAVLCCLEAICQGRAHDASDKRAGLATMTRNLGKLVDVGKPSLLI